jgi:predicted dehydrogenase
MPPLRVAVIGAGAFGRNHLRVYRELESAQPDLVQLAALVEPDLARRDHFANLYNIPAFASVTDLLNALQASASDTDALKGTGFSPSVEISPREGGASAPEGIEPIHAASVCVPTLHHATVAAQLLRNNIDTLIEKPFAATLEEADRLLALAAQHNRILAVGHLERFNPAVTATLAALNNPMFFEAHRLSVFTPRSLDVDVVLDLMIHDLDIVLSLTNSPVKEVRAVGLPVISPKTDIANVRIEFHSGCVANFTASRVSTEQVRKLRLFQPHQYLSLDFARQELLSIDVDPNVLHQLQTLSSPPSPGAPSVTALGHGWDRTISRPGEEGGTTPSSAVPAAAPTHPTAGFSLTKSDVPKGEPLRLELEDFLHSVRNRTAPRVPGTAGRAALALALEINRQIAAHARRAGLT